MIHFKFIKNHKQHALSERCQFWEIQFGWDVAIGSYFWVKNMFS